MAQLPEYKTLSEKQVFFQEHNHYKIDTREQLDDWYQFYTHNIKREYPTDFIFRGSNESKYQIFSSAQRVWIQENLGQWQTGFTFKDFIISLVNTAKRDSFIKEIFDSYDYSDNERDFPIISLLQHYGAPSPVVDWTYDLNRALYFAVDGVRKSQASNQENINHYISIYLIDKRDINRREFLSLLDIAAGSESYPSIEAFRDFGNEESENANSTFTLSDFETTIANRYHGPLKVRTTKPLTSLFNQNIIAQKGLLMFNPFKDRPIEQLFNVPLRSQGSNLHLQPFNCFNIHKDLAEYLRRKIQEDFQITKSSVYPNLYDQASSIKESVLNQMARS